MAFKQYIKINIQQFDQSSKCFFTVIPIDSVNIRHLIKYSFAGGISEREHFYNTIIEYCCNHNKGNYTTYDEILCFFEKKSKEFRRFLINYKNDYILGSEIEDKTFVKFYFQDKPNYFRHEDSGRNYIDYKKQLETSCEIKDKTNNTFLSAGYFDHVFLYFQNHDDYGESIMILKPIKDGHYRLHEYECLGDKFNVINYSDFSNIDFLKYIYNHLSKNAQTNFLSNHCSDNFEYSFGEIDKTIDIMKTIDENRYKDAIGYLMSLKK